MKLNIDNRFKIGDKVIFNKKIYKVKDIIIEGSISALSVSYIIARQDKKKIDVIFAFESELMKA